MAEPNWRVAITTDDAQRLRGWRDAWMATTDAVRTAGQGAILDQDNALFDLDRVLDAPLPPPGDYRCRWIKLGSIAPNVAAATDYPSEPCRIVKEGSIERFNFTAGPQRPQGGLFPDTTGRGVFLGTLRFADERRALDYGRDSRRDMAGFVERIGDRRWRIALPQPQFESRFDIIEITPAA
jgi:hypothetical protein